MEYSSDAEMQKLTSEAREFFAKVLYDEDPIFVSDEATIFDVSTGSAEELSKRCSQYYGKAITPDDLKQPLWMLLRQLNQHRTSSPS